MKTRASYGRLEFMHLQRWSASSKATAQFVFPMRHAPWLGVADQIEARLKIMRSRGAIIPPDAGRRLQ